MSRYQLTQRLLALLLVGLVVAPEALSAEAPNVAAIDVYGSSQITIEQIEAKVGRRLREMENLRSASEREAASELRAKIEAEIEGMGEFAYVRISRIQYFKEGRPIYLTIDLVDTADADTRLAFASAPTGKPLADPDGLLAAWQGYEKTAMSLMSQGKLGQAERACPAFHCIVGFAHPELESYGTLFETKVPEHRETLAKILMESSDEVQRGSAAYLLAHINDGQELVTALLPATRDPSYLVRNNVLRVLQQVAREQKDLDIPLEPIVQALNFPATTDRNKSLALLDGLANRPALRGAIARQAGTTLIEILKLVQPNNHDYAYSILKKISGQDFGEHNVDAWRAWLDQYLVPPTESIKE